MTETAAVPTDEQTIADIRARSTMALATRPDAPLVDRRSALRVEDVSALLRIIERQHALLDEAAEALAYVGDLGWVAFEGNEDCGAWVDLTTPVAWSAVVDAIRSLVEEMRR